MALRLKCPVDDHQQDWHYWYFFVKKPFEWDDRHCMKALVSVFVRIQSICQKESTEGTGDKLNCLHRCIKPVCWVAMLPRILKKVSWVYSLLCIRMVVCNFCNIPKKNCWITLGEGLRWISVGVELHLVLSEQFECHGIKFWMKISVLWRKERMLYEEDEKNLFSHLPGCDLHNTLRS